MHAHAPARSTSRSAELVAVAIIPARYQSSRLPGKPLALIGDRPMIEHVYRRAADAPSIARVIVATDDRRIADAVRAFGGDAVMTRPDHASGSDRLAEVARTLDCDLVVNVQGDEPLLPPVMIEEAIAPMRTDPRVTMATLRRRITDPADWRNPNVVKVVVDRDDFALYFSRHPIPYLRNAPGTGGGADTEASGWLGAPGGGASKHIGLYVYRREFLLEFTGLERTPLEQAESLEQLRALEHGYRIKAVETSCDSLGVDTAEDLERARRIVAARARS